MILSSGLCKMVTDLIMEHSSSSQGHHPAAQKSIVNEWMDHATAMLIVQNFPRLSLRLQKGHSSSELEPALSYFVLESGKRGTPRLKVKYIIHSRDLRCGVGIDALV